MFACCWTYATYRLGRLRVTSQSVSVIHRSVIMSAKIETILGSLTLEEKVSLLAGKDFWETVPIPDKGVPAIKVSGASR